VDAERKIVELLKERGCLLQSEIVNELKLAKSTVSEVLKKLEREGLIVRERVAGKSYRVWYFESSPKPCEILRVGILRASEYPHILLALKDLDVKYSIKVFDSALKLTKEISSGRIDVGFSPFITQTVFAIILKSMKIHAIVALNGSGIAYKGRLDECKVFATSEFSAMESNLKLALESFGLDIFNLTFRYFDSVENALKNFKSCEYDAIALWEPYLTALKSEKVYFKDIIGDFPCCSMASSLEFYKERRDVVRDFVRCIRESLHKVEKLKEVMARELSKLIGFNWKIVLRSFESYKFVCKLDESNFRFLERYGLKLTPENIRCVADPIVKG